MHSKTKILHLVVVHLCRLCELPVPGGRGGVLGGPGHPVGRVLNLLTIQTLSQVPKNQPLGPGKCKVKEYCKPCHLVADPKAN